MKGDPEERAIAVGRYIAGTGATVRAAAVVFGVSKSTIWKDQARLRRTSPGLWAEVQAVVQKNKAERHLRGGRAGAVPAGADGAGPEQSRAPPAGRRGHPPEIFAQITCVVPSITV